MQGNASLLSSAHQLELQSIGNPTPEMMENFGKYLEMLRVSDELEKDVSSKP